MSGGEEKDKLSGRGDRGLWVYLWVIFFVILKITYGCYNDL